MAQQVERWLNHTRNQASRCISPRHPCSPLINTSNLAAHAEPPVITVWEVSHGRFNRPLYINTKIYQLLIICGHCQRKIQNSQQWCLFERVWTIRLWVGGGKKTRLPCHGRFGESDGDKNNAVRFRNIRCELADVQRWQTERRELFIGRT
ncbi:hypothetical protein J6590_043626 [Homalodisca vitripennis]|nr:hypothetical protein J6590_043626 [Homalodisca vitripennis]